VAILRDIGERVLINKIRGHTTSEQKTLKYHGETDMLVAAEINVICPLLEAAKTDQINKDIRTKLMFHSYLKSEKLIKNWLQHLYAYGLKIKKYQNRHWNINDWERRSWMIERQMERPKVSTASV
jgi:hypothetical protein